MSLIVWVKSVKASEPSEARWSALKATVNNILQRLSEFPQADKV